jgi:chromosome partitioning protein
VKSVINMLKLALDDRGERRAAARAEWFAGAGKPLDTQYALDH